MTDDDLDAIELLSFEDFLSSREEERRAARSVAAINKLIDEFREINRARLAPAWAKLGEKCDEAEDSLREFLDFEQRGIEVALPSLLESLRRRKAGVLTLIADMLDPDKPGPWKLELRRNLRGAPSEKRGSFHHWIALEYFELFEALKEQGVRSPAKETTKRLIAQWKWSPNEIRAAVHWWRERGIELKR